MTSLEQLQAITQPAAQSNDPRQLAVPLTVKDLVLVTDAIANSSSGSSYLVYTALLTQTGTNAPVATMLENTLGGLLTIIRSSTGIYSVSSSVLFTENKTAVFLNNSDYALNTAIRSASWQDSSTITIITLDSSFSVADDLLSNTALTIKVYS